MRGAHPVYLIGLPLRGQVWGPQAPVDSIPRLLWQHSQQLQEAAGAELLACRAHLAAWKQVHTEGVQACIVWGAH